VVYSQGRSSLTSSTDLIGFLTNTDGCFYDWHQDTELVTAKRSWMLAVPLSKTSMGSSIHWDEGRSTNIGQWRKEITRRGRGSRKQADYKSTQTTRECDQCMNERNRICVYEVVLSSGSRYILAPNSEEAAWSALELSLERDDQLLNVKLRDEW